MVTHRTLLASASVTVTLAVPGVMPEALAADRVKFGDAAPFSSGVLIEHARAMTGRPHAPPATAPADILSKIDYKAHDKIRFDIVHALFADGPGQFPVTFSHLGTFLRAPMRMHMVEKGAAHEIVHDELYFDTPVDSLARKLPRGSGFAGFRFRESRLGNQKKLDWKKNDWIAFLGASYFRAIGELYQYGFSVWGIVLDVAQTGKPEEFPSFTHVWFNMPADNRADSVTTYMLFDGPNITGTYHFVIRRTKGVVMDIDTAILPRKDVDRFDITPAASTYRFSETAKDTTTDWRPEVYDPNGLAFWIGDGGCIWRPLNDPPHTTASASDDSNPRGFGLLQCDHDFNSYQGGVHYEHRPSLWVESLGGWGEGVIQLIEIPTDDEIHDNTTVMWVPKTPARTGGQHRLRYRLHWPADEPYPTQLTCCAATCMGNSGQPDQSYPHGMYKFTVEFRGGPLERLPLGTKPETVLSSSRGTFSYVFTEATPDGMPRHQRVWFDLTVDGEEPVDMWLSLRVDGKPLSETLLYQYHPFQSPVGPVAS